jgi:hypothetical protein
MKGNKPVFDVIEKNIPVPKRRRCADHNKFIYDFVDHAEVGDSIALSCRKQCNVLRNVISSRKKKANELTPGFPWNLKFTERELSYTEPGERPLVGSGDGTVTVKYWRYWRVK